MSQNGTCRLWTKAINRDGYGVIKFKSPTDFSWKTTTTHRLSFVVFNRGSFEDIINLEISHLCHNRLCVNKDHLYAETHAQNMERGMCINRNTCLGHLNHPACLVNLKL